MCGQGMQALDYLEASKVIYTNGCIDKLVNWIHSNLFLLGGVALGLAIPQVTYPVQLVGLTNLWVSICGGIQGSAGYWCSKGPESNGACCTGQAAGKAGQSIPA